MSEAIILGNGKTEKTETIYNYVDRVIDVYRNTTYRLTTNLITSNTRFTVPSHYGNIYVRLFGGGGSGGDCAGGGGGYGRGAQYCEYNLGHGKNMTWYTAGYGGGGAGSFRTFASSNYSNGGNGICIVQYYKKSIKKNAPNGAFFLLLSIIILSIFPCS